MTGHLGVFVRVAVDVVVEDKVRVNEVEVSVMDVAELVVGFCVDVAEAPAVVVAPAETMTDPAPTTPEVSPPNV